MTHDLQTSTPLYERSIVLLNPSSRDRPLTSLRSAYSRYQNHRRSVLIHRDYVGNDPSVKSVCFCFPFPFFPFGAGTASASMSPSATCDDDSVLPVLAPHAATAGAPPLPKIFRNDTLPLTCGFARAFEGAGKSGNSAFDSFGGGPCAPPPLTPLRAAADAPNAGPGDETMDACVRIDGGAAELVDHGVARWPVPRYFCGCCCWACCWGPGDERPSAGKRSGTRLGPGWANGVGADEVEALAARATRFQTCCDCDARVAVACFALRTRPEAIPA